MLTFLSPKGTQNSQNMAELRSIFNPKMARNTQKIGLSYAHFLAQNEPIVTPIYVKNHKVGKNPANPHPNLI